MVEEQIVYDVKVNADQAIGDVDKFRDALVRVSEALKTGSMDAFADAFARAFGSVDNFVTIVNKLNQATPETQARLSEVSAEFWGIFEAIKGAGPKIAEANDRLKAIGTTAETVTTAAKSTAKETDVLGGVIGKGGLKFLKFAGMVALGAHIVHGLASKIREAARAFVDWIRDGIDKALEKNTAYKESINRDLVKPLDELQTKIGAKALPALAKLASAVGSVIETLDKTGVINAFGDAFVRIMDIAAGAAERVAKAMDRIATKARDVIDMSGVGGFAGDVKDKWKELSPQARTALAPLIAAGPLALGPLGVPLSGFTTGYMAGTELGGDKRYMAGNLSPFGALQRKARAEGGGRAVTPEELPQVTEGYPRLAAQKELVTSLDTYRKSREAQEQDLRERQFDEAIKKAAEDRQTKLAVTSLFVDSVAAAFRSGGVKEAALELGMEFATAGAKAGIGAAVTKGDFRGLFKGYMGFAEGGYIPSAMPAVIGDAPGGEYVLSRGAVESIAAGYGAKGGKPGFEYDIPGRGGETVVNINPSLSGLVDVETVKRFRRGSALLESLEA